MIDPNDPDIVQKMIQKLGHESEVIGDGILNAVAEFRDTLIKQCDTPPAYASAMAVNGVALAMSSVMTLLVRDQNQGLSDGEFDDIKSKAHHALADCMRDFFADYVKKAVVSYPFYPEKP